MKSTFKKRNMPQIGEVLVTPQRVGMMMLLTANILGDNESAKLRFDDAVSMLEINKWDLAFRSLVDAAEHAVGLDGAEKIIKAVDGTDPLDNSALMLIHGFIHAIAAR